MIEKKRPFKKIAAIALLSVGVLLVSFGGTWAYYYSSQGIKNPLTTGSSSVAIIEDFNPDSSFLPGETAIKKVAFKNTGDMDVYLRVKVPPEEGWYYGKDVGEHKAGDESDDHKETYVMKNYTQFWGISDGAGGFKDGSEWMYHDGYMYYRRILYAAQTPSKINGSKDEGGNTIEGDVTQDILSSIKLSPEVTNDRHQLDYSDMVYKLTFEAEAIPVEGNGPEDKQTGIATVWGMQANFNKDTLMLTWDEAETPDAADDSGAGD